MLNINQIQSDDILYFILAGFWVVILWLIKMEIKRTNNLLSKKVKILKNIKNILKKGRESGRQKNGNR